MVDAIQARLADAGLASIAERGTTCCYAKQDKFWVQNAPDAERWEVYTVLADSPTFFSEHPYDEPCCCAGATTETPGNEATLTVDAEPAAASARCC